MLQSAAVGGHVLAVAAVLARVCVHVAVGVVAESRIHFQDELGDGKIGGIFDLSVVAVQPGPEGLVPPGPTLKRVALCPQREVPYPKEGEG